jgi:hypothetical protein
MVIRRYFFPCCIVLTPLVIITPPVVLTSLVVLLSFVVLISPSESFQSRK